MRFNNKILLSSLFGSFLFLTGCSLSSVSDSITEASVEAESAITNAGNTVSESVSSTGTSVSDYFGSLFGGSE